ncbi:hypothetical protein LAZ67_14002105 [Cordylochernes scorpioides]|uniref:Reverse transcriptase domain-containing protein n=1 Tax=Cordylochernes scorpioides TaxID=51811 RepID=A0ABY6L8M9_9ARAC|nr:hypothetical protein LAZ67_14002105 [Cordylochernes scorpioides]
MDSNYSIKLSTFNGVGLKAFIREVELEASIDNILDKYKEPVARSGVSCIDEAVRIMAMEDGVENRCHFKQQACAADIEEFSSLKGRRHYSIPYSLLEPYKVLLDKFLESGIIKRSRSDWNSPEQLVKKPDGSLRSVLDLRQVNDKLRNQDYSMIRIDTAMAAVGGAEYFSTLDLASGYYQLKLDSNREMHRILSGLLGKNCQCFIDDVLIYSESLEQHLADLTEVLDRLRKYGLQVRPSKCQLFQEEVIFLGHRVDKEGIHPKEKNIEKIKDMSPPKTVSGVRRFLGAVGFYRKFIAGFSEIAAPLYELTKKGTRKKFMIFTDASDIGCGGMLSQLKNGTPQPITFYSHKFRGAELNYSTIEKECLAIIMAIEQIDYYIYGQQVEIYCDHKPLQYLKLLENKNRMLMKWALMLQDRELTFSHVNRKENAMAVWLSRDTYNTEVVVVDVYEGVTAIPNYEKSMLNYPVWETVSVSIHTEFKTTTAHPCRSITLRRVTWANIQCSQHIPLFKI